MISSALVNEKNTSEWHMAFAECLDAWDDCFSFFNGKSPYHTTRRTRLSHFTRNQRVAWKLLGALSIFTLCVCFQCFLISWDGAIVHGREQTPPLVLFVPMSALYSVISMWVSAVHLYQPTFNGPRILLHYRRSSACSWEILDWVFFEGSTTGAVVAFLFFWLVTIPYSGTSLPGLCAFGNLAHLVIVSVDFYFTAPLFKANHVFLVLLWPVLWILIQFLWVVSGHEPSNDLFNFHSLSSPLATLVLLVGTAAIFYVLHWYSRYLHRVSGKGPKAAVNTGEDAEERSSTFTPTVPFELVVDTSVETRLHA